MHLPGFELETSLSVVLLHLHLTTQPIRICLVVISYWSQTSLAKALIYSYLRGYPEHGLLFSNVDFKMATCADETVFYEKLDALKASKPIAADSFLKHVETDLTDFRNLPCHKWVLHINDYYSKYSWLIPLKSKT